MSSEVSQTASQPTSHVAFAVLSRASAAGHASVVQTAVGLCGCMLGECPRVRTLVHDSPVRHRNLPSWSLPACSMSRPRWEVEVGRQWPRSRGEHESEVARPKGAEMAEKTRVNWRLLAAASGSACESANSHGGGKARLGPESDVLLLLSDFLRSPLQRCPAAGCWHCAAEFS